MPNNLLYLKMYFYKIEKVNAHLSGILWYLLDNYYGFKSYLFAIRNTYLMGKGELFQNILDFILGQIETPILSMNETINRVVLRNTAKLLNLDEDAFLSVLEMKVSAPNILLRSIIEKDFILSDSSKILYGESGFVQLTTIPKRSVNELFSNLWNEQKVLLFISIYIKLIVIIFYFFYLNLIKKKTVCYILGVHTKYKYKGLSSFTN